MTFGMPNQRVCSGRLFRYPPNPPTFALKTHDKHLADCGRGTRDASGSHRRTIAANQDAPAPIDNSHLLNTHRYQLSVLGQRISA
jgi:hypothetical protein